ncbi:serine/threonine-protein phosphatase 6 regulatory ankyrin repeat subunit A-like [Ylistrum balloti]|uniref:serine/threonine-protein phosphatase 6 regulatory ankyrin repeat subunit A-like n=1 Tax=Ylistrum balloti TaxID=509963 RepID=UPI0029058478|nr:serine/threonine-protein phosphatase 6 regulatory ankyrin repeat subunit A-like [Ylistrum balloti]
MGQAASKQEAFWEACGFGHTDRVQKFLSEGDIDVNWVSYTHDCCPIHVASQGKPAIVQMLLDANCNVNVKDNRGNLPIHHAAMKGHSDIIESLIAAGSEINTQDKNGWTPLHCAAYWGHLEAVRVLVKQGADVNTKNKDERTALHETARSQDYHEERLGGIATILIDAGSDVNAKSSDLGEADFTGLMFAAYHNHPEVALAFINSGCDINAFGTNGWTALHWAVDRNNEEMVYVLLEEGVDPTKRAVRGELASDRTSKQDIKDILMNAVNMFNELALLEGNGKPKKTDLVELPTKQEGRCGRDLSKTGDKSPEKETVTGEIISSEGKSDISSDITDSDNDTTNKEDKSAVNPTNSSDVQNCEKSSSGKGDNSCNPTNIMDPAVENATEQTDELDKNPDDV